MVFPVSIEYHEPSDNGLPARTFSQHREHGEPHPGLLHNLNRFAYDLDEIGLDAGTTYQRAIDIGMSHELTDIGRGDAQLADL